MTTQGWERTTRACHMEDGIVVCYVVFSQLSTALKLADHDLRGVLGDVRVVVHHVELLTRVLTRVQHDRLLATRVLVEERGHAQDLSVHRHPAVILGGVLRHLSKRVLLLRPLRRGRGSGLLAVVPLAVEVVLRVALDLRVAGGPLGGGCALTEVDGDALRGGVHAEVHCAASTAAALLEAAVEEAGGSGGARDAAEHDAVQQGGPTQAVQPVDTARGLTTAVESGDNLTVLGQDLSIHRHLEAAHAVVDDGGDDGDVEGVVGLDGGVVEDGLSEGALPGGRRGRVVVEGLLDHGGVDVDVPREVSATVVLLHQTTAGVVGAVPLDGRGSLRVEAEAVRPLVVVPHSSGDVVTLLQLVHKPLALVVDQDAPLPTKGLGREELDLRVGLVGVHQGGRVHLHHVHVDHVTADGLGHLDTVTSAVDTVGGRQVAPLRAHLLQETTILEVVAEPASADHHGTVLGVGLPVLLVGAAHHDTVLLDQTLHGGLHHKTGALGLFLEELLELLHQGVGDRHAGETLLATVATGLRGARHLRHDAEVKSEVVHQPVRRGGRVLSEAPVVVDVRVVLGLQGVRPLARGGAGLLGRVGELRGVALERRTGGVTEEDLRTVDDAHLTLHTGGCRVHAGRSLGRVTTAEGHLLQQHNATATLEDRVGRGQTRQTAANNDALVSHCDTLSFGCKAKVGR
eukprot:Hpha_TRINITY_DN15828_c0_g2::TRINITY_DN15828_c0_g2_i1::g.188137::m.188137